MGKDVGRAIKSTKTPSDRQPKSTFKNALKDIFVPPVLQEGVHCLRVFANGKTQNSFLTLSNDKFTLYLTTEQRQKNAKRGPLLSLGRKKSATTMKEKAIDIGAIDRIQRGHSTKRFEMARKHRQDSMKSLLSNGSSNGIYTNGGISNGEESTENILLNPSHCFSVIFRGDWTLDFMMLPGSCKRDEILDAIDNVVKTYQNAKQKVSNDVLLLRYYWLDALSDKEKSQFVGSGELQNLLLKMNYFLKARELNDVYEKFARAIGLDRRARRNGLTFEQTCTLLHKIKRDSWIVKPVNLYWNNFFGEFMKNGKPRMTVSDRTFLEKFLRQTQGEDVTIEDVRALFARLNALELPHIAGETEMEKDPTRIDKNRFEAYLLSAENDCFDPRRQKFDEKTMNRPISEYWINSSHNTYLTGDQFRSNSSVDMYSNALYRGCRCLELDIWDGDIGSDGSPRPVVWHGHTMTSKILFQDIIKALKLFLNFHPDTFPLILSFENHCSIPYQEVIADQLQKILGKSLYIPKEESLSGRLPSPMDLRGMVVIKGRRPSTLNYDDYISDDDVSDDGAPSTFGTTASSDYQAPSPKQVHHSICPALARLTLFHGTKYYDWESSIRNQTNHMHSFSENKMRSLSKKTNRHQWTIYNQSHMSRAYPAGSRLDSSNYLPVLGWSVGCQLVSLNFQTADTGLLLNDGRFRENGGCGYVLKSDSLLEQQEPTQEPRKPLRLSIRVLSGSCLPKPKATRGEKCIDPYVKASVFDIKNGFKEDVSSYQTGVVYNNGFSPIWNEETFKFSIESWPSAMLQLTIFDKQVAPSSDEFVATASIPISCLRQGLRSVKLTDSTNSRSGTFDFASLLIDVKKGWGTNLGELRSSSLDQGRGSVSKPVTLERARTETSRADTIFSDVSGASASRFDRISMDRSRTDQSKGDASLAEF